MKRAALTPTRIVAGSKYGGQFIRHRRAREIAFLPRIRRCLSSYPVLQLAGYHDSLLLFFLRTRLRTSTDGVVALLVWLVGG